MNIGNCGHTNLSEKADISIGSNADSFTGLPIEQVDEYYLSTSKKITITPFIADKLRVAVILKSCHVAKKCNRYMSINIKNALTLKREDVGLDHR